MGRGFTLASALVVILGFAALVFATLWIISLVGGDAAGAEPVTTPDALHEGGVIGVPEIANDPDRFIGRDVAVAGQLSFGVSTNASLFNGLAFDTENILVLTEGIAPSGFPAPVTARVEGTLIEFTVAGAEQRLGVDLDDGALATYEGEPAIIADSVHLFVAGATIGNQIEGVVEYPVTVTAEVTEVLSPTVFVLGDQVLAVLAGGTAAAAPAEGEVVNVTGTASMFQPDGAAPGMAGASVDLTEDEAEEYNGHPMVVVDSVEPA